MHEKEKSTSAGMTRQSFLKAAALLPVAALGSGRQTAHSETLRVTPQMVSLTNGVFALEYQGQPGIAG